jgi:hypothetical protein
MASPRSVFHTGASPGVLTLSLDKALIGRTQHTKQHAHDVYSSDTPLRQAREAGVMTPLGDWWATPEFASAAAHLAAGAAKAAAPPLLCGRALDLLTFRAQLDAPASMHVRRRTAFVEKSSAASPEGLPPAAADADAALALPEGDEWLELDSSSEPTAVLLQHSFALPGSSGTPGRTLTLRTLVFGDYNFHMTQAAFARAAFGELPVAVQPDAASLAGSSGAPTTAVAVDGAWLSAAALSAAPSETRDAVKAARKVQLLRAARACITRRWAGGYGMLRKRAGQLLSAPAAVALEALAAHLVLARAGGAVTDQLLSIRTGMGELFESVGQYRQAAGMYLLNLASQHDVNEKYDPSDAWANLGCALIEARDLGAAEQALEHALRALDVPAPLSRRETPWWRRTRADTTSRESARLRLLWLIMHTLRLRATTAAPSGDKDGGAAASAATAARLEAVALRMFRRHLLQHAGEAVEGTQARLRIDDEGVCWESSSTGARFMLRLDFDAVSGEEIRWIERVPAGEPLPPFLNAAEQARRAQSFARGSCAQLIVDAQRKGTKLPTLPSRCAQCGAAAAGMKRCGGCARVAYCSTACSEAHWRAGHKAECGAGAAA